jgi:hypothetical protein
VATVVNVFLDVWFALYFPQVASALHHLQCKNVAHRDIKLENILFFTPTDVKLVDFGLAAEMRHGNPLLTTICGSLLYVRCLSVCTIEFEHVPSDCRFCSHRWPLKCFEAKRTTAGARQSPFLLLPPHGLIHARMVLVIDL